MITSTRRRTIIAVLTLLGAVSVVGFSAWSLFVSVTCDREVKSAQTVDISPLVDLSLREGTKNLVDEIDLGVFHSYRIFRPDGRLVAGRYEYPETAAEPHYSYIDVDLSLFESTEGAAESFVTYCENRSSLDDLSDFEYGTTQDGQFCISYTKEARAGPEGLCQPLGYYYSFVVIRNANLLIWINEQTSDIASTRKNAVIEQLARELAN